MKDVIGKIFSPCHCNVLRKAAHRVSHTYDLGFSR
jgi:hypothetical protein